MKLLFLVSSMEGGGAERVAALLCNAWAERGWQITLIPTFSGRGGVSYPVSQRVQLHYLADDVNQHSGKVRRLVALRRYILNTQPDLIVSFLPHVNIAGLIASLGTGVPVIACERTYPPLSSPSLPILYRALVRLSYRRAALLGAQTEGTHAWLKKRFPHTPAVVIPNPVIFPLPVNNVVVHPYEIIAESRSLLLGIGRLVSLKRLHLLIEAFTELAPTFSDWDLVLLGAGDERDALADQIKKSGLEARIHLPGFVGNLSDWYSRADIYVMTSAYEGFPNTILEAMAHGLPTVAFDVMTGPKEITDNGRRGILLPDDNHVERLGQALEALMSDACRRKSLGSLAQEVRDEYSMPRILAMWDDAIAQATNKSVEATDDPSSGRNI